MNSPGGDETVYYENAVGGAQMTPTVVSNFNLPNSNINKDGPYLKIIEQPQTKFRFRYKSEMVGTHGQLKAESSDKNKNIFPTVKLCNWNKGLALIRLMLYTAEDNVNERKRHVHELNGKNCNKEGFVGGCEVVVDEDNHCTAQFSNLGIIHIAKRDVQNIIFLRKKEELINQSCMNNPGLRNVAIQHNIPPTKLQKLKEEAEEEARKMDLNKVVLRFQAFFFDTKSNFYRPVTEFVDSDVILNLKNASTGELKIVRISAVSSPCTGGTEVWMLVEKVKKNNVKIKFYEVDNENREIWKGYGMFKESDVHHQYAIVFRTPAYRFTNIREPVHVKVQLERTPDNDTSEPIDFTFLPENLKRTNMYIDSGMEAEMNFQKRRRQGDMEAIDLKTHNNLFLGSRELKQPYSPETPNQSPSHMVPSPITPADSPSSQGFYSPPHRSSINHPSIIISSNGDDKMIFNYNNKEFTGSEIGQEFVPYQVGNTQNIEYQQQFGYNNGDIQNGFLTNGIEGDPSSVQSSQSNMQPMFSPGYQVPSPGSNGYGSPLTVSPGNSSSPSFLDQNILGGVSDNAFTQIQQFDAVQMQVIHSKNQVSSPQQWDFSDWVNNPSDQLQQNEDIDLLDIISNNKFFAAQKDLGDIQADCARSNSGKTPQSTSKTSVADQISDDVEVLTNKFSNVSVHDGKERKVNKSDPAANFGAKRSSKDLALSVALSAADCLQSYAVTGDVSLLLATHRYLLAVPNIYGENSLHMSVNEKNKGGFQKILKASTGLLANNVVNAQNIDGQTPLHLAVASGQMDMTVCLLLTSGCNVTIADHEGNTALHLAAVKKLPAIAEAILSHSVNGEGNPTAKIINLYNYHGQTPLHMAVISGCLDMVKQFLICGAHEHLCEKKQGSNPLHLSAMHGRHDIMQYLINNTSIAVDASLLDGNTALHIAAQAKDKKMCQLLMAAKANSHVMNNLLRKLEGTEREEETGEEEGKNINCEEGFTPIDYAEGNEEILQILQSSEAK